MSSVYKMVLEFKNKYPNTIGWRLKKHSMIVEKYLNKDEKVIYAFAAQKSESSLNIASTCVFILTNKRILIGRSRLLFGYFINSITPDMFNDLKISGGFIWGKVHIDTVKEYITLSNISLDALSEIESEISSYMLEEKKKYKDREDMKESE